jgi:hypothetical protein
MTERVWYAADVLMADLTIRHHHAPAASEAEVERKMRERYPEAVAVLGRQEESWRRGLSRSEPVLRSAHHPRGGRGSDSREP